MTTLVITATDQLPIGDSFLGEMFSMTNARFLYGISSVYCGECGPVSGFRLFVEGNKFYCKCLSQIRSDTDQLFGWDSKNLGILSTPKP